MVKCKCKKCGVVMNIPRSYADLCYDCSNDEETKLKEEAGKQWNE